MTDEMVTCRFLSEGRQASKKPVLFSVQHLRAVDLYIFLLLVGYWKIIFEYLSCGILPERFVHFSVFYNFVAGLYKLRMVG
jgi:hypothetical protein